MIISLSSFLKKQGVKKINNFSDELDIVKAKNIMTMDGCVFSVKDVILVGDSEMVVVAFAAKDDDWFGAICRRGRYLVYITPSALNMATNVTQAASSPCPIVKTLIMNKFVLTVDGYTKGRFAVEVENGSADLWLLSKNNEDYILLKEGIDSAKRMQKIIDYVGEKYGFNKFVKRGV